MKIIAAKWIFDGDTFIEDRAVAFAETIQAIDTKENLLSFYPDAEVVETKDETILMPGLINPHVHLEFGANTTQLCYGDFMTWLQSVISNRDTLIEKCKSRCYKHQIESMLHSGTTTFGAVSSYGFDMKACKAAPQRVIYFNEAIGSQPAAVDALYADFMQRLEESQNMASKTFIPAAAIHSPYSVHPVLIKKIVKNIGTIPLSAHFMESLAEKEWLENGSGPFKLFFEKFLQQHTPLCTPENFLENLSGHKTLLTHAVQADEKLLNHIKQAGHVITHCPRSNRLLGCGKLDIEAINDIGIKWLIGTDGLSSNTSLNLWDEMRSALMMHTDIKLQDLASSLLRAATSKAATALDMPIGKIIPGNLSDIIVLHLPNKVETKDDLAVQMIVHTKAVSKLFIQGKQYV